MNALPAPVDFLAVDEYLAAEEKSDIRHEYLGGKIFAMAGGTDAHNSISLNFASALNSHLRGRNCRTYMADVKLRIPLGDDDHFFYPDVMVTCDPRDTHRLYKQCPRLLIEALSEATERVDRFEKFLSYRQIESLDEYIHAAQDRMEVTIYRRSNHWKREVLTNPDDSLEIHSVGLTISLREIYDRVNLKS